MEIINLGRADGLPPVDWSAIVEKLDAGSAPAPDALNSRTTWLSTVNEDGSSHVTAVGALWLDGTFWFQTGAGTRKGRNVTRDPRCSIAVSIRDADVVLGGRRTGGCCCASDRAGHFGASCEGVGGPRLAGRTRRERAGHHCPVQRPVAGTTAVERVSH
jgi:Pyridoxamine 5'-phosphate oxidase